jgi:hypothetical protein
MTFKTLSRWLSVFLLALSATACLPVAISLPSHIELPSIKELEQTLDLPLIRLEPPENPATPKRKCSEDTPLVLRGSGLIKTETRVVEPFTQLVLTGLGDIFVEQGSPTSLEVKADENLLPYITTSVDTGQLILGIQEGVCILQSEIGVQYFITVQDLDLLTIIGAGSIQVDQLKTQYFTIQLDGSAQIVMTGVDVKTIQTDINGAGTLKLTGSAETQIVNLNGFGQYQAGELECRWTDITLNGTGDIDVWAVSGLEVELNGLGSVSYYGDPALNTSTSGLAGIERLGAK